MQWKYSISMDSNADLVVIIEIGQNWPTNKAVLNNLFLSAIVSKGLVFMYMSDSISLACSPNQNKPKQPV